MRLRSVIATLAALACLLVGAVAILVWRETRLVESAARECAALIEALAALKTEGGGYPSPDSGALPANLVKRCNYQPVGEGYVLVLGGSTLNLQAYEYDSRTRQWQWD